MAYNLIQADDNLQAAEGTVVFLGGSSRGNDWREMFYREFSDAKNLTFVSPFRTKYSNPETNPKEHAETVTWEREAIASSNIAVFWLGTGLSNQAARVEIGFALGAGKTVIVGADDSFLGLEHLSAFGNLVLASSLEALITRLKSEIEVLEG